MSTNDCDTLEKEQQNISLEEQANRISELEAGWNRANHQLYVAANSLKNVLKQVVKEKPFAVVRSNQTKRLYVVHLGEDTATRIDTLIEAGNEIRDCFSTRLEAETERDTVNRLLTCMGFENFARNEAVAGKTAFILYRRVYGLSDGEIFTVHQLDEINPSIVRYPRDEYGWKSYESTAAARQAMDNDHMIFYGNPADGE